MHFTYIFAMLIGAGESAFIFFSFLSIGTHVNALTPRRFHAAGMTLATPVAPFARSSIGPFTESGSVSEEQWCRYYGRFIDCSCIADPVSCKH